MPGPPDDPSHGGWSQPGESTTTGGTHDPDRYELGAVLGKGGMGVVHAARDHALGRDVALKELPTTQLADALARARLAREAAITARLDHPGIITVHEVGVHGDGRPYYTMRLVRGGTLRGAPRGDTTTLLRHLLAACEAVAAAHDAGLVHRDLKPENILVGPHGETQVIDWGLAAPTPEAEARWAGLPAAAPRGRVGTEAYMAPEQAAGAPPDPRHDVWSLGLTLKEIVGEPLPPELAAIVRRATAPPATRYADAGALADDLLAFFEGRRVAAHEYSPGELLRRAARAYRGPLIAAMVGLACVGIAVGWGWWRTGQALDRALNAEHDAQERLADLRLDQAVEATRADRRETAERLALDVLDERDDPLARGVFASFGRAERPVRLRAEAGPACAWSRMPVGGGWILCGTVDGVDGHGWHRDGRWLGGAIHGETVILWDKDGTVVALDATTGAERGTWSRPWRDWVVNRDSHFLWVGDAPFDAPVPSGCQGRLQDAAASADGRTAFLAEDGTLLLGTVSDPVERRVDTGITGEQVGTTLAWLPDGSLLVGTVRGRVVHLDSEGRRIADGQTSLGLIERIVVAPDGRHAALLGTGGRVGLWRIDREVVVAELAQQAHDVAFSADGVVVHAADQLHTFRIPAGTPAIVRGPAGLADVAVAPDGRRLAIAGGAGHASIIDLVDGSTTRHRFGDRVVKAAAFGPNAVIFSGLDVPKVAAVVGGEVVEPPGARPLRRIAVLGDGTLLGVDMDDGLYRWADRVSTPEHLAAGHTFVDMERDDGRLILLEAGGEVYLFAGETLERAGSWPDARAVALRGEHIYVATAAGIQEGDRVFAPAGSPVLDLAVSADGQRIAAAQMDGHVRVYAAGSGALLLDLPGHRERAVSVEFLPDGDLASASWDGTARIADLGVLDRPVDELRAEVEGTWGVL